MGNHKSGTLGKRMSRRVRRNQEHALKARGKREKAMVMESFKKGFNLGADMFKARILNATAGYEYEATENVVVDTETPVSIDPMSESTLGSDPAVVESDFIACAAPLATEPWTSQNIPHHTAVQA